MTGADGKPSGVSLYNPWGFQLAVTKPDVIHFCSSEFRSYVV